MIRAIIFDFNGVIADDEAPHVACFCRSAAEAGLSLTIEEYYGTYLGMDERTCAAALLAQRDGAVSEALLQSIIERKAGLFHAYMAQHRPTLFPGIADFVAAAKDHYRLAIASGGRREQIRYALAGTPIEHEFDPIVAAEDCGIGKPDPAIYLLTLDKLNHLDGAAPSLSADQCLVIEDSLAGIRSAKASGMRVLALATTYPAEKLGEADLILQNLQGVTPASLLRRMAQFGQERGSPAPQLFHDPLQR
jgi:HAD superfamily hydrolase (TIGR01509 family)